MIEILYKFFDTTLLGAYLEDAWACRANVSLSAAAAHVSPDALALCRRTLERSEVTGEPALAPDATEVFALNAAPDATEVFALNAARHRSVLIGEVLSPLHYADADAARDDGEGDEEAGAGAGSGYDVDRAQRRCAGHLCFLRMRGHMVTGDCYDETAHTSDGTPTKHTNVAGNFELQHKQRPCGEGN